MIDECWFYANEWNLPDLRFSEFNAETEPTWHELESVEYTVDPPTSTLNIKDLLSMI